MAANPLLGVLLYVLGGAAGASFYLPFRKVKDWAWESYWMVYCLAGLIAVPWALAFAVSPNVVTVLRVAGSDTLLRCYLFGAMWGLGGLTWGLMIRYLGVGLGLAMGCGLCAATGTLVPPIFRGEFGALLSSRSGTATLIGVAVSLVGIVVVGAAGMAKERELPDEKKKEAVAEFNFRKGLIVAIFSGVMSAGMAFGLGGGAPIEQAALVTAPLTPAMWKGIPVLVVVLLGGFTVNFAWCLYLNLKNRTAGDYVKSDAPLLSNTAFAALAGAIWCSQFIFFKVADTKIGAYAFAGWTVLMSSAIFFSSLLGIVLGEWRGVSARTKRVLAAGLIILVVSLVIIGYGNYLKG
ncbi:MAG: L-rhamnose/proton symporter RhaT [Acidobacteria bacterium]|nr:L-rhamnose/proton symporter RhaT [Acidobacteriota bacterium]